VGRAAERPPLTRFRQRPLVRIVAAAALGAALEAGVSLAFYATEFDDLALAAAWGILVAVLAAALGGPWAGAIVAAAGWTLQFFLVVEQSWRAAAELPVWLAVALVAGVLAARFRARSAAHDHLRGRLVALEESSPDAVIALDPDGAVVAWNAGAEAIYGYAADEALRRSFVELATHEDDDGAATQRVLEALARGERATEANVVHRRKDGTTTTVSLTGAPIGTAPDGRPQSLAIVRDVSEVVRAREAAGELEERYASLTEQLPGATYMHAVGERETFLRMSPQAGTMLGYRAEDWTKEPGLFFRLVHEEDRERVREEVGRAADGATPLRSEYRILARNGSVVWVRDEATTVRARNGAPLYVQGHLVDITTEKETRAERERLRAAERTAASESAERQVRLDFLSRASVALSTFFEPEAALRRAAELAVEGLADWCVVDLLDEHGNAVRAVVARGDADPVAGVPAMEPDPAVVELLDTGERLISEERISVLMVARGRTVGAITLLAAEGRRPYGPDDVAFAEHLARLAAFSVENARLHQQVQEGNDAAHVLTYVADGVFLVDRGGVIRLWNPTVAAIVGLEPREVIGRQAADVIPDWHTLAERIPVGGAEPVQPETLPMETEYGERWISVSGVEFFDGIVYALRDLTEVRRLEQLKAEFVATASHELRTPLAAVYGAAQTLRRHDFALDEAGRERFVSLIVDESERLGRIVNDILLANQLDIGVLDLRSEAFDPTELVERVVEAARAHAPASIVLEAVAEASVPTVASDRDRVRQVLVNLVENAIKYSPSGGHVTVGVAPAGKMVRFYVRDEGIGIPADEQRRIFDKFYRLDPQMTAGVGGTGLGLYICSELVQRMGGRIWVESDDEEGSTFLFEIPAAETSAARALVHDVLDASTG
jgi:PAS domain S-box-containing protein